MRLLSDEELPSGKRRDVVERTRLAFVAMEDRQASRRESGDPCRAGRSSRAARRVPPSESRARCRAYSAASTFSNVPALNQRRVCGERSVRLGRALASNASMSVPRSWRYVSLSCAAVHAAAATASIG